MQIDMHVHICYTIYINIFIEAGERGYKDYRDLYIGRYIHACIYVEILFHSFY